MSVDDRLRIEGLEEQVALLREALTARDTELRELQEKLQAWQAAGQRERCADGADPLTGMLKEKDEAIRELQARLDSLKVEGAAEPLLGEGLAQDALRSAEELRSTAAERDAAREEAVRLRSELQECTNELAAARCEAAAHLRAEAEFEDLTVQLLRARGKVAELEQAAARAAGPAGAEKEQEVAQLRAAIAEKGEESLQLAAALEQLSEALEVKTTQLATANKALEEAAQGGAGASQERLRVRLEASTRQCHAAQAEAKEARQQAEELAKKVQRLESQLLHSRAEQEEALARSAKPSGMDHAAVFGGPNGNVGGRIGAAISELLQDVELGEKAGVTLTDLGCSTSSRCLGPLDRSLQRLMAMMTVRADARLGGFALWATCHALYVACCAYWFLLR